MAKKTREDVEKLKMQWKRDPSWDIETTEGYEEYHDELLQFRKDTEAMWKARNEKRRQHLASLACPLSFNTWVDYGKDDRGHAWLDCKMEECALWDDENELCSLRAIGTSLYRLVQTMENRP